MDVSFFKPPMDDYSKCAAEYERDGRFHVPGVVCCVGHRVMTLPARDIVLPPADGELAPDLIFAVEDNAEASCEFCGKVYNVARLHIMREKRIRTDTPLG